jgi:hypothetical protein
MDGMLIGLREAYGNTALPSALRCTKRADLRFIEIFYGHSGFSVASLQEDRSREGEGRPAAAWEFEKTAFPNFFDVTP